MLFPCLLLALASSALGQMTECWEVTSVVCPDGDVVCDLGMTGGCWNGNYCMPEGSICLLPATTPSHPTALEQTFLVTWVCMAAAGTEITACLQALSAPLHAIPLHQLCVLLVTWSVTMVMI